MRHDSGKRRNDADVMSNGRPATETTCSGEVLRPIMVALFRYFLKHTQDDQVADDLVGQTMLEFLKEFKANKIDPDRPIERYIWGIARHIRQDYWRAIRVVNSHQIRFEDDVGYEDDVDYAVDIYELLNSVIDSEKRLEWIRANVKLSKFQYKVFEMRAEGLTNPVIATFLKTDAQTVSREYSRAREKIQKMIKPNDVLE
jgi:RNA polymerase sigma factor (sigma-70 family)